MRITILATAFWTVAIPAGGAGRFARAGAADGPLAPESRVWITGSSNFRLFDCSATGLSGSVELRANPTRRPVLSGENVSDAPSLRIPVAQLDCGISAMNHGLRQTLRADAYESVEFHLDSYDVQITGVESPVRMAGRLRIAGTERPVVLSATVGQDTLGNMRVRGTYVVRMTHFGLEPPRRLRGLLRVQDQIVVHFDIVPGDCAGPMDIVQRPPGWPAASHATAGGTHASDL
jgi:hypothetical protein